MMDWTRKLCAVCATMVLSLGLPAMAHEGHGDDDGDYEAYGPEAGDWELTLGGAGQNDREFDNGGFNLNGSLGYFFTEAIELSVRQGVTFVEADDSSSLGSTRAALDYHFDMGRLRPFVGANLGIIYGEDVDETGAAGLEAGIKWYALEDTFIFVIGEYQWFFDSSDDADDTFDDGLFVYGVGIGFNF